MNAFEVDAWLGDELAPNTGARVGVTDRMEIALFVDSCDPPVILYFDLLAAHDAGRALSAAARECIEKAKGDA